MSTVLTSDRKVVQLPQVLGKTQQRVQAVLKHLRENPRRSFTYHDLTQATGMPYDALLYVLHALAEVGVVDKHEVATGPGRPRVSFQWASRALGARQASAR